MELHRYVHEEVVLVGAEGIEIERMLQSRVGRGVAFASSLPRKKPKRSATRAKA